MSDDNAFVEALFRTAKYRPQYPANGFADLNDAREWAGRFVRWYNHDHRHSAIRFVSPAQRPEGHDRDILDRRHTLYLNACAANPRRWTRHARNRQPIDAVTLNPECESIVSAALAAKKVTASAA